MCVRIFFNRRRKRKKINTAYWHCRSFIFYIHLWIKNKGQYLILLWISQWKICFKCRIQRFCFRSLHIFSFLFYFVRVYVFLILALCGLCFYLFRFEYGFGVWSWWNKLTLRECVYSFIAISTRQWSSDNLEAS